MRLEHRSLYTSCVIRQHLCIMLVKWSIYTCFLLHIYSYWSFVYVTKRSLLYSHAYTRILALNFHRSEKTEKRHFNDDLRIYQHHHHHIYIYISIFLFQLVIRLNYQFMQNDLVHKFWCNFEIQAKNLQSKKEPQAKRFDSTKENWRKGKL